MHNMGQPPDDPGQYVSSYPDDLIFLREAREALIKHGREPRDWIDASFCRVFIILLVSALEAWLREWGARGQANLAGAYFAERGVSNGQRVNSLRAVIRDAGIEVDSSVLDDFLALKYIRNKLVHSDEFGPQEKDWIASRGFPTWVVGHEGWDWNRLQGLSSQLISWIALAGMRASPKVQRTVTAWLERPTHRLGFQSLREIARLMDAGLDEELVMLAVLGDPEAEQKPTLTAESLRERRWTELLPVSYDPTADLFVGGQENSPLTDSAAVADAVSTIVRGWESPEAWRPYTHILEVEDNLGPRFYLAR
jgi:hypothetical protein